MPELPEVQTTVDGINDAVKNRKIIGVWSNYTSAHYKTSQHIKSKTYWEEFKKKIIGQKILKAERIGKNILIRLSNKHTIHVHMKMTGHFLFGRYKYRQEKNEWVPIGPLSLKDPFNQWIRLVFILDKNEHFVLSDLRKFAKVHVLETNSELEKKEFLHIALDPLSEKMTWKILRDQVKKKPRFKIKQALLDQALVSGIGNIYSDEILWHASVHPESITSKIPDEVYKKIFSYSRSLLNKGIDFGGDSFSDYRNIYGEKGEFQEKHRAYKRNGQKCSFRGCDGMIVRKKMGGRSAHFCSTHQIFYK